MNKDLNFPEAYINIANGQLIIDSKTDKEKHLMLELYRNVVIRWNNKYEITVTGLKANFNFFIDHVSSFSDSPSAYNEENFHLVDESEIITVKEPIETIWDVFFNRKPTKFKEMRRIKGTGWVELKETNIPHTFISNNYLIIQ